LMTFAVALVVLLVWSKVEKQMQYED